MIEKSRIYNPTKMAVNYKLYILLTSNSSLTFIPILLNNNSKNGDLLFHHFSILFGWCNHRREPYQDVLIFLEDWHNVPVLGCSPAEADTYQSRAPRLGFGTAQGEGLALGKNDGKM